MKPYLTLTAARPEDLPDSLVKPKVLHAYLTDPGLGLTDRVKAVSNAASTLVHADADPHTLMSHLAQYRKAVGVLAPKIDEQVVGLMLPPNERDLEFYHLCSELYSRLAAVCKRIILTAPDNLDRSSPQADDVIQACYWAIYFLGERLQCAYRSYAHAPTESWYEIHQIYRYSESNRIETAFVHIDEEVKVRNISHIYIRVLLLGICNPYHLPFRAAQTIFKALDDWAKLVHLSAEVSRQGPCMFLINPDADLPAMPMPQNTRLSADAAERYLDTTELVSILMENLSAARDRKFLKRYSTDHIARELESRETLKKLIVSWGLHPIRKAGRVSSDRQCDTLIGLRSVASVLDVGNGSAAATGQDPNVVRRLKLIDESEHGARARVDENDAIHVRIGELVAQRKADEGMAGSWSIGMIRWAQTNADEEFHIGIFKFISDAVPVAVRYMSLDDGETPFTEPAMGLWTIRTTGEHPATSLILGSRHYKPGGPISVERGDVRHMFEIREVVLSTRCFLWFDVSLTDSTPQHSVEMVFPRFSLTDQSSSA